jgi:hypothetical protein
VRGKGEKRVNVKVKVRKATPETEGRKIPEARERGPRDEIDISRTDCKEETP